MAADAAQSNRAPTPQSRCSPAYALLLQRTEAHGRREEKRRTAHTHSSVDAVQQTTPPSDLMTLQLTPTPQQLPSPAFSPRSSSGICRLMSWTRSPIGSRRSRRVWTSATLSADEISRLDAAAVMQRMIGPMLSPISAEKAKAETQAETKRIGDEKARLIQRQQKRSLEQKQKRTAANNETAAASHVRRHLRAVSRGQLRSYPIRVTPDASLTPMAMTVCESADSSLPVRSPSDFLRPSTPAVMSSAASSSSASAPLQSNPRVRKLYRHALESIFAFATLRELHRLLSVSRDWSSAVMSMKPLDWEWTVRSCEHAREDHEVINWILRSRLMRHVSTLRTYVGLPFEHKSLDALEQLVMLAPWMRQVHTGPFAAFPDGLERVCLALSNFDRLREFSFSGPAPIDAVACNQIIATIGKLNADTMRILRLRMSHSTLLSLAPLSALTGLQDFTLGTPALFPENLPFTDQQICELRAMTSLRKLHFPCIGETGADCLVRLLQPGHSLRWTELALFDSVIVTDTLAEVLGSLVTLTSFHAELHCADVHFLSNLRALTNVALDGHAPVDPAVLVRSLSQCTQITKLSRQFDLTGDQMEELLSAFPLLTSCSLEQLPQLSSLRCFSTPALASSLGTLDLCDLPLCPPTQVVQLLELRSLQYLLIHQLAAPLSADQEAHLQQQWNLPNHHLCL